MRAAAGRDLCGSEHEEKSPVWRGRHLSSLNQHLTISRTYRMTKGYIMNTDGEGKKIRCSGNEMQWHLLKCAMQIHSIYIR